MRRGVAGNAGLYGLWRLVHLKRKIFGKDIRKWNKVQEGLCSQRRPVRIIISVVVHVDEP